MQKCKGAVIGLVIGAILGVTAYAIDPVSSLVILGDATAGMMVGLLMSS